MKALVTGADGFVGRWLTRHLEACGDEVWKACGRRVDSSMRCVKVDVTDSATIRELVHQASPDAVYHLAAVAFGPDAAADMENATRVTVGGTVNVLEAARTEPVPPIVMIPSSAEVYDPTAAAPITEDAPIAPASLYGATKAAQETIALAYERSGLVPVVVARAFNHIGPGQHESFVVPAFAGQLAEIALGRQEAVLRVGNLDAERDFTDVRDVARAYRLLVDSHQTGRPLNVATGRPISVRTILSALIGLSGQEVEMTVDPGRLRPVDRSSVMGSSARLRKLTGWRPEVELSQTLSEIWAETLTRHRVAGHG